jgi:hypothetical protein
MPETRERFDPNTGTYRDSGRAQTWSAGVTIFGVGLSARSGFSRHVKSEWEFGSRFGGYWLCGSDAPFRYAKRVYAGW